MSIAATTAQPSAAVSSTRALGACPHCRALVALDPVQTSDRAGAVYQCAWCQTVVNEHLYFTDVPGWFADMFFAP